MSSRIAVVTGASGGLGRVVAEAFRQAGDQVVSLSRSSGEFSADLSDAADTERAFRAIAEHYGRIDCLIHTTGGFESGGDFTQTGPDVWQRMLTVNLLSSVHAFRAALPYMLERGQGRIVATGSRAGEQLSPGLSAYAVSKAALHTLVRTVAEEVKASGVTVNAVLPGTIDTAANRAWGSPEQIARWVRPESIAATILWLASDEARDVNGALVPVYGQS